MPTGLDDPRLTPEQIALWERLEAQRQAQRAALEPFLSPFYHPRRIDDCFDVGGAHAAIDGSDLSDAEKARYHGLAEAMADRCNGWRAMDGGDRF